MEADAVDYQRPSGDSIIPMLDALRFDSLPERNSSAHSAGIRTKTELIGYIENTFTAHDLWVERIRTLKSIGLPDDLPKKMLTTLKNGGYPTLQSFKKLSVEARLRIILFISEREAYHVASPPRGGRKLPPTSDIPELIELIPKNTARYAREAILADYFLPRHVVTAAMLAIQSETWLNTETIVSVTSSSVRKTKRGYEFTGLKGRTDQFQNGELRSGTGDSELQVCPTYETAAAVRGIELLLANIKKIENALGKTDLPILFSLSLLFKAGAHVFDVTNPLTAIADFCKLHNRPTFDTRYLRDLGVQIHYLSPTGTLYGAQVRLGHGELSTTEDYLRTNLIHFLHQANMRRFIDLLAASILWRTGRTGILEKHGLHTRNFKLDLLFPLDDSQHGDGETVIARWLDEGCNGRIAVGLDEMEQCALQYQHYLQELPGLAQNRRAFIKVHIPRVLCCVAMRQIFMSSQHASIYKKIEGAYLNG